MDALVTQSQSSMKFGFKKTFGYVFDIYPKEWGGFMSWRIENLAFGVINLCNKVIALKG
jgi:hypothetical protein